MEEDDNDKMDEDNTDEPVCHMIAVRHISLALENEVGLLGATSATNY